MSEINLGETFVKENGMISVTFKLDEGTDRSKFVGKLLADMNTDVKLIEGASVQLIWHNGFDQETVVRNFKNKLIEQIENTEI